MVSSSVPAPRIVHVTSVHKWNDIRILYKECAWLANEGYHVTLVVPCNEDPAHGSVHFVTVPRARSRHERLLRTVPAIFQHVRSLAADIVHFHDPELIPIGLLLRMMGRSVVYDVHEDVPADILDKPYLHPLVRKPLAHFVAAMHRGIGRILSGIVAVTPEIAAGFGPSRIAIVRNLPLPEEAAAVQPSTVRPHRIVYAGAIVRIRGIRQLVDALPLIPAHLGARLTLAGEFEDVSFEAELTSRPGWQFVDYKGLVNRQQLQDILQNSAVGVVPFLPSANHLYARPNKIYEYMAAGLPMVISNFPSWRAWLDESHCGIAADPEDPAALAAAITELLEDPRKAEALGQAGWTMVHAGANWAGEFDKLIRFYDELLAFD